MSHQNPSFLDLAFLGAYAHASKAVAMTESERETFNRAAGEHRISISDSYHEWRAAMSIPGTANDSGFNRFTDYVRTAVGIGRLMTLLAEYSNGITDAKIHVTLAA